MMADSDLEMVARKSLIDDQKVDDSSGEKCQQLSHTVTSNHWLTYNDTFSNISPNSTVSDTEVDCETIEMSRKTPVPVALASNNIQTKIRAKKIKKNRPNVIKVEECTLSDIDYDSPLGKKFIKKYGLHCLQSKDASSEPSPGEPVIVDLDDFSNTNSNGNNSTKLNTQGCNGFQIDEYNDTSESESDDDRLQGLTEPASNFLFTNNKVCSSSDSNNSSQGTSTFGDNEQSHVNGLVGSSYPQPASNGSNDSETCNNWEIGSIFSNLKEFQYPFLDDGNVMQVAQNITPASFNSSNKSTQQEDLTDSRIFGMSFYDPRTNDFSVMENSIDSSSYCLDEGSLKSPGCGREINSGYNGDTLFVSNNSQTNESHPVMQTSTQNNLQLNTNTCSIVNVNPTLAMQNIPQHVFNTSGEHSPSLNLFQSKSVATPDDMTIFDTNQPHFYYSQNTNYGNYYQHTIANQPAIITNANLPVTDITDNYNQMSSQGVSLQGAWYAPPSTDSTVSGLAHTFTSNEDDEETDDADELDNIPVKFAKAAAETMPQYFASPRSVASTSCFSNDSSMMQDFSPSPSQPPSASSMMQDYSPSPSHPPSACSTPGLVDNAPEMSTDFYNSWHNPVPQTIVPQLIDMSKTFCPSIVVPNYNLPPEKREAHMMPFTLPQGLKRPFLSMADAMRSSRTSRSKRTLDVKPYAHLDTGLRKNQIQSAKISTSTPKNIAGKKKASNIKNEALESPVDIMGDDEKDESKLNRSRHNEPLNQHAVDIMTAWFYEQVHNPYPTKVDKEMMAREGGITENQVKSWFANKRNRTNNTKPKVQKRAMEEKLLEVCKDLKRNHANPLADNSHIIQQLSGIIQHYHSTKQE